MVMTWHEWSPGEAAARWDAHVTAWPDYNLYQGYRWGEFKRQCGWRVRRGSVLIDGQPAAVAQCLVREVAGLRVVIVWVPGGPIGTLAGRLAFRDALRQRYRGWHVWMRVHMVGEARQDEQTAFADTGWIRPAIRVSAAQTIHLDLTAGEESRRAALTANWRHNLNRGEHRANAIEVWSGERPLDPVYAVYEQMVRLKGIAQAISRDELRVMRKTLGDACTVAVAFGAGRKPCAIRAFARLGARAQDLLAGVTMEGRHCYANYPLMWKLLELAREQGVRIYDLNGIDAARAVGVLHFKQGLGGRLMSLTGEWEWATSVPLRWGVSGLLNTMKRG